MKKDLNWAEVYNKERELDEYFDSPERQERYGVSEKIENYYYEWCPECMYQGCACELHRDDWEEC